MVLCIAFLEKSEREEKLGTMKNEIVSTSFLIRASNPYKPQFSHHNKGFINFVFCRNWAVRNPAGTMLDSLAW